MLSNKNLFDVILVGWNKKLRLNFTLKILFKLQGRRIKKWKNWHTFECPKLVNQIISKWR